MRDGRAERGTHDFACRGVARREPDEVGQLIIAALHHADEARALVRPAQQVRLMSERARQLYSRKLVVRTARQSAAAELGQGCESESETTRHKCEEAETRESSHALRSFGGI